MGDGGVRGVVALAPQEHFAWMKGNGNLSRPSQATLQRCFPYSTAHIYICLASMECLKTVSLDYCKLLSMHHEHYHMRFDQRAH